MVKTYSWLLDTNTLSEAMKPSPNAQVLQNLAQFSQQIAMPALVWHELRYGWLRMPSSKRKDAIGHYLHDVLSVFPIIAYDENAAKIHAQLCVENDIKGITLPFVDGQIAAIAMAQGLTLVTRNLKDFENIDGLRVLNWFSA
jgi:tRNA(fMet)-specific endonuclease VapC